MSTWIFLRGLTRESRHWGGFPAEFHHEIPDAQVLAPDLPGNGTQNQRTSPLRIEEIAEDIRARLIEQGLPPPYYLLAMSLGAMAAISWTDRHPEEIHGCVLINTSLRPFSPVYRRLKPANYPRLLKLALLGGGEQDWESTILELTSRQNHPSTEILSHWTTYRREHPVHIRNALRQLWAAARFRAPLAKPPAPILVLTSREDALVDTSCSRQLALNWHTAFAEHPTAGHDIPLDDGPWVARQVRLWLQALPAQASRANR